MSSEGQTGQRRRGDQPADHRDGSRRDDRQLGVAVLHANQIGVALVVFDVNPHARCQFGRIQHAELGPVGDPVRRDELDGGATRTGVEHLGLCDTHIVFDRKVIAHGTGHQQQRLQRDQAGHDQHPDACPTYGAVPAGVGKLAAAAVNENAPPGFQRREGTGKSIHKAALMAACNCRSEDRSALTSSTRSPAAGSSSAAPSASTSICRLSM